jgi:hypothetical protein
MRTRDNATDTIEASLAAGRQSRMIAFVSRQEGRDEPNGFDVYLLSSRQEDSFAIICG